MKKDDSMLQHIAVEITDKSKATLFFSEILGLEKQKSSTLPSTLNRTIFGNEEEVEIEVWSDDRLSLEVFITGKPVSPSYRHICLAVPDMAAFLEKCTRHKVPTITAKKGDKEIIFIKDFSGNLYEIKEA